VAMASMEEYGIYGCGGGIGSVTQRCQAGETQKRLLRPLRTADHKPR
jgi:hypothetical protein